jgi:uncharacterized protein
LRRLRLWDARGRRDPGRPLRTEESRRRGGLDRLVVNLSRDCNLRCRYCYADGGAYGGTRELLSPERGREIAAHFLCAYPRVGSIQFFGGEPFLNLPALESVCAETRRLCEEAGTELPRFSAVTNGTVWSEAVADAIRRWSIAVTVSLDGSRAVHDANRVTRTGEPTFDRVVETIRAMKDATGQPAQVEATYTRAHLDGGFSFREFMDFLARDLDVHLLHMPWILGGPWDGAGVPVERADALADAYEEAVVRSLESLRGPDLDGAILLAFVQRYLAASFVDRRGADLVCGAGSGTLSVDVDGTIYPCFMFTGKAELSLGRVGALGPGELEERCRAFEERIRWPDGAPARERMLMACAGMNLECGGGVADIPVASTAVNERLAARLETELEPIRRDPEAIAWLKTKLALVQMAID